MAREKATITLDRAKVDEAIALTGSTSMSSVIDLALDRLLKVERALRDVVAYGGTPLTADELLLHETIGMLEPGDLDLDDDDVDYVALYGMAAEVHR